ncbi:hypothetical protein [Dokdonella sp.]|uniref:leucine-rich repeat domain-containing protein n=1 Tax=Dokdonella sp. TaxID=2291710 RepID=UPI001B1B8B2B|nr:hypothetical protein [Dokdonella sp.]MBO9661707.1 hypothetical protein [Dokdonella sp.]
MTLLFGVLLVMPVKAAIPDSERQALLQIYQALDGPNWTNQGGWNGPPGTECFWDGVYCSLDLRVHEDGPNVRYVSLVGQSRQCTSASGVSGTLPALTELTQLYGLGIQNGTLTVAPAASELPASLEELSLCACGLTGQIPDYSSLSSLQVLYLGYNRLSGVFPSWLANARSLKGILLQGNFLYGSVPDLSALTELTTFDVRFNAFSGQIPPLSGLTALVEFLASENWFSGSLPALPESLKVLVLDGNYLDDMSSISGATGLVSITASKNSFFGPMPDISNLKDLQYLYVPENSFTALPLAFGAAGTASPYGLQLQADHNKITGDVSVDSDGLSILDLSDNELPAKLVSIRAPALMYLYAENANLYGTLPDFSGMPGIQQIVLDGNQLNGGVEDLSELPLLWNVQLSNNRFSGWLPALPPQIQYFGARGNLFTGPIADFSPISGIVSFDVRNNLLTGTIPDLSVLTGANNTVGPYVGVLVSGNQLEGSLPQSLPTALYELDVEYNRLSGPIPSIDALPSLSELWLAGNAFTGTPPATPASLRRGSLCPNDLDHVDSANWDAVTDVSPWYSACTDTVFADAFDNAAASVPAHKRGGRSERLPALIAPPVRAEGGRPTSD